MQNTRDIKKRQREGAGTYLHAHRCHGMLLPVPSTNVHANPPTIASLCRPHPATTATTATCKRRAVLFPVSWCVTSVADVVCRHHAVLLPVPWRVTDVADIVYRHRLQCSMFTSIPSLFNTAACNACKRRAVFFPMPWHVTGVADVICRYRLHDSLIPSLPPPLFGTAAVRQAVLFPVPWRVTGVADVICRQRLRRSIVLSISSVLLALPPSEACDRHPASASRHDDSHENSKKAART